MISKEKAPAPVVGTVRGASVCAPDGSDAKHTTPAAKAQHATDGHRGRRRKLCFSEWMQTEAPHGLGLHNETVHRIARCMAAPEMRGVTSLDGLIDSLRWLRKPFYSTDPLAWKRFEFAARALWWAYRGRVP